MAARQHSLIAIVLTLAVALPLLSLLFSIPDSARASRDRIPQSLELAPVTSLRANFVSTVNKIPVRVCQEQWATATRMHGTCNHLVTLNIPELQIEQRAGDTVEYVFFDGMYYERRNDDPLWDALSDPNYRADATLNAVLFNDGQFPAAGVLTEIGQTTVATTIRTLAPTPTPPPFVTAPFSFTTPFSLPIVFPTSLPINLPDTSEDPADPAQDGPAQPLPTPVAIPSFPISTTLLLTDTQPITRPIIPVTPITPTPEPEFITQEVDVPVRHFQFWSLDRQRNAMSGGQFVYDIFVSELGYVYKEQFNSRGRFRSIGIAEVEEIWVYADPNAPVIVAAPRAEQVRTAPQGALTLPSTSDGASWLR